jgi:Luciferase-like monooxygenase
VFGDLDQPLGQIEQLSLLHPRLHRRGERGATATTDIGRMPFDPIGRLDLFERVALVLALPAAFLARASAKAAADTVRSASTCRVFVARGDVAAKFDDVRRRAAKAGRHVTLGVRLHLIVRETTAAAWRAAKRLLEKLDDATIANAQQVFARMDSVGPEKNERVAWRPPRSP